MDEKRSLIHIYEILDIEYDELKMIAEALRKKGKSYAADDVDEAKENLFKVILEVKKSWKFLESDNPLIEQMTMNI